MSIAFTGYFIVDLAVDFTIDLTVDLVVNFTIDLAGDLTANFIDVGNLICDLIVKLTANLWIVYWLTRCLPKRPVAQ
jgi:hypothetical protein